MRDRAKPWRVFTEAGNSYKMVTLEKGDTGEFYFKSLIAPPASKLACLDFRFKKFTSGKGSLQKKTAYFMTLDQKVGGYLFQNIISFT